MWVVVIAVVPPVRRRPVPCSECLNVLDIDLRGNRPDTRILSVCVIFHGKTIKSLEREEEWLRGLRFGGGWPRDPIVFFGG